MTLPSPNYLHRVCSKMKHKLKFEANGPKFSKIKSLSLKHQRHQRVILWAYKGCSRSEIPFSSYLGSFLSLPSFGTGWTRRALEKAQNRCKTQLDNTDLKWSIGISKMMLQPQGRRQNGDKYL